MTTSPLLQENGLTPARQRAIETLYRAFNEQDPALLDAALMPDWIDTPMAPGQPDGPAGLKAIIGMFVAAFPDVKITVLDLFGQGDRAAVRAQITGTHRGSFFGIAATGKAIDIAIHEFHYFDGERIAHTWHLEDWFGMLNQLGAWPAAPQ